MTDPSTPTPPTALDRFTTVLRAAARAARAVAEHYARPGDLQLEQGRVLAQAERQALGVKSPLPASVYAPGSYLDRHNPHDAYVMGYRDAVARLVGITGNRVPLAVVDLPTAAAALLQHHPERTTPDGPINGCECGRLQLGEGWAEHAVAAVFDALPTVHPRTDAWMGGPPEDAGSGLREPRVTQGPGDNWQPMTAGQLTEFVGRQVKLPTDREHVPHDPVLLESARFEFHTDGDSSPDGVLVKIAGHPEPYLLLPTDLVHVRTSR